VPTFSTFVAVVGAAASLIAAALWFYASWLEVPDNIDTFIGELKRISRWNSYAAMAACVAAVCAVYGFIRATIPPA
jgi:hypothetical protein